MLEATIARSKVFWVRARATRCSYSGVMSRKQLMAPTISPSPSRSGWIVTLATQRRPSGFSTQASTPSKLSPC